MRSPSVPLQVADAPSGKKLSWMQEMFNYPAATSPARSPPPSRPRRPPWKRPKPRPRSSTAAEPPPESKAAQGTPVALDAKPRSASAGERALLERLQERRQELDARARELDLRESMLKAAEKKLEKEAAVEKAEEAQGRSASAQRKDKDDADGVRFKGSSPCTRP